MQIAESEANLSCFTPERRHKVVKGIANHTFRFIEPHVLSNVLNEIVEHAQTNTNVCKERHLGPSRSIPWAMQWVNLFCNDAVDVLASSQARLKHGFAVAGDLLWFPSEETIGSASGFIEIVRLNIVENILLAQTHAHKRLDNNTW